MRLIGLSRIRSFRFRMTLLSAVVSGVVLAAFGGITFAAVQRINLNRMDQDIREFTHRHLVEPQRPQQWERVSEALTYFFGDIEKDAFILLVKGPDGEVLYGSANWPEAFAVDEFPSPEPAGGGPYDTQAHERGVPDYEGGPEPGQRGGPGHPRPRPGERPHRPPMPERRGGAPGPPVPPPGRMEPRPGSVPLRAPEFATREADGTRWRMGVMGNPSVTLVLGLNLKRLDAEMAQVRSAFLMALPVALVLVAGGAWLLSQRALKPIKALTATVEQVTAKGLDQRITVRDTDEELTRLIAVFNGMMARLEKSFHQAGRFSADASHELKTPLAILQGQLEQALNAAEPDSEEQRRYGALSKEVQRLKSIVKKLLLLSRVDAGELRLNLRPLNLSQLLEGTCEDAEILAPHLQVKGELAPNLWVMADPDLLKQVVQNLATNAIKYNQKGGVIHVHLRAEGEAVRCLIANSGKGIPPEDGDKVFTRFYRGDKARSRRIGGVGLGLSLAREIVRAHHGDLRLEDSPEGLTVFSMILPRTEGGKS